uniref:Uncharacterized protein n=1 Tax=Phalansterium sp. PJK-2012 TaxID=1267188 RepID=T1QDV1_9EUKA|nr:hypothetical protein [Phalansterium sp. PJK-2012]
MIKYYYYIVIYFWFFLFTIIGAATYYEKFPRISLRDQFVSVIEDEDENEKNWKVRPPTEEELEKTDLPCNKMFLFETTVYSTKEEKFIKIWITFLIQQGNENSLLKRGIYFNVISPITHRPAITIRSSQLEGTLHTFSGNNKGNFIIVPSFVCYGFTSIWEASVCVTSYDVDKYRITEEFKNDMLAYLLLAQENAIDLDVGSYFHNDPQELNNYVNIFFGNIIHIAKQYIAMFIMKEKDWDPNRKSLTIII